jgi:hypothetical protein
MSKISTGATRTTWLLRRVAGVTALISLLLPSSLAHATRAYHPPHHQGAPRNTASTIALIKRYFPPSARAAAARVAFCESKFHSHAIAYDANGTHDRGLFQLNDGGTQQYLLKMLGYNPRNLELGLNPVLNVRAAALLYTRDGWSPWTCRYAALAQ